MRDRTLAIGHTTDRDAIFAGAAPWLQNFFSAYAARDATDQRESPMKRLVSACSVVTLVMLGMVAVSGTPATASTKVFGFTGAAELFTVPPGTASLAVVADGASGGFAGGPGGRVTTPALPVAPGEVLQILVGGAGGSGGPGDDGGFNGGGDGGDGDNFSAGGGGATDIRRAPYTILDRLIIAGGGGAGGIFALGGSGAGAGTDGQGEPGGTQGGRAGGAGGQGGAGASGGGGGGDGTFGQGGDGGAGAPGGGGSSGGGGGGGGGIGGGGGGGDDTDIDGGVGGGGGSSHGQLGSSFSTAPFGGGSLTITFELQPDIHYKMASALAFEGDEEYSSPDDPAKISAKAGKNKVTTFEIAIQNDGDRDTTFLVTGTAAQGKFTAAYKDESASDITPEVTGAGYTTGIIAPSDTEVITLEISGKKGRQSFLVTASDGSLSDSVLVTLKIKT